MKCRRCKGSHKGLACKVPFGKAWPGMAAVQLRLRSPSGKEIKIESDLSPDLAGELAALVKRIVEQPEPAS